MDGAYLGLAGLLLGISLGLRPREIPQSSPASHRKTPFTLLFYLDYPGQSHPLHLLILQHAKPECDKYLF